MAARSLTETLTEAARAAVEVSEWERDQEAWNLPRGQSGTIAPEVDEGEVDVVEGDPGQEEDPTAIPPEQTE